MTQSSHNERLPLTAGSRGSLGTLNNRIPAALEKTRSHLPYKHIDQLSADSGNTIHIMIAACAHG